MKNCLTIIVPTYNRSGDLRVLLNRLACEIGELSNRIQVIIGNNASSDNTDEVVQEFIARFHNTIYTKNSLNIGPDENFCKCIELVTSEYFWIIGDDDLPKFGVIKLLELLLVSQQPDFVYLNNRWVEKPENSIFDLPVNKLAGYKMRRRDFARKVNIWFTFISSCVVRTSHARSIKIRKYCETNLVQLAWVYESIIRGDNFIFIETESVLARSGNTGGYSVLKVFFENFPAITSEMFAARKDGQEISCQIQLRVNVSYLPGLIRGFRGSRLGKFSQHESIPCLITEKGPAITQSLLKNALTSKSNLRVLTSLFVLRLLSLIINCFDKIKDIQYRCRQIKIYGGVSENLKPRF